MSKKDLLFRKPLINAAGMLGFAPDLHAPIHSFPSGTWDDFGAFVTNPVSLRARRSALAPELIEYPGGLLLHTGLPNPGFSGVITKYSRRWEFSPIPIILHLLADHPDETARMVRNLEGLENISAVELGFAPHTSADVILAAVEMSRGELPLIAQLPFDQITELGPMLIRSGAAALSFAAPRGSLNHTHDSARRLISGRLYGPGLYPQSLDILHRAVKLRLPVIAGVGVYRQEQAADLLAAGAMAVQLDTVLWV
jgi:dihydroorotate dehydrogenase (NAD+) catalytic subunit